MKEIKKDWLIDKNEKYIEDGKLRVLRRALSNNYIDEVFPMNYHTQIDMFQSLVDDYLRLLGEKAFSALHIGVGVMSTMGENSPEEVSKRLQILKNAGLPGAMLFNKSNIYNDEYCQVIKALAEE